MWATWRADVLQGAGLAPPPPPLAPARLAADGGGAPRRRAPPPPAARAPRPVAAAAAAAAAAPAPAEAPPAAPPAAPKLHVTQSTLAVTPSVALLRFACAEALPEVEFSRRRGTTLNCYLLRPAGGREFEVLVDVPSRVYDADVVGALAAAGALRSLRAVALLRLNPERIPTLRKVLAAAAAEGRALRLLVTNPGAQLLRERAEGDAELAAALGAHAVVPVTRGFEERFASGAVALRFTPAPTPRWPEMAAAYAPQDRLLFSSNLFSAHVAPDPASAASPFDDGGWAALGDEWRHFHDCMFAPAARQAARALDRLRIAPVAYSEPAAGAAALLPAARAFIDAFVSGADDGAPPPLAAALLAPAHGPVVRSALAELVAAYGEWTAAQVRAAGEASVAVMFASAYGNTAALAQAIARGVTKAGVGAEALNLETAGVDAVEAALAGAAGFVIGSPTLGGHMPTQVTTALGAVLRSGAARSLPCGVFGSYGWSGEAVDTLEGRLRDAGFRQAFEPIRCKFAPTEAVLRACEEAGTDLAQEVRRRAKARERTAAGKLAAAERGFSGGDLALGRVVGTLCVLTVGDEGGGGGEGAAPAERAAARSAMLASWVSQASFDPPGLTVAVKKDRAVEALLPPGAGFVLNVLAEGRERGVVKQLSRPFAPGEDRLAGLAVRRGSDAAGGAAVLEADAASFLECAVEQRLEAGDHWVVYARVLGGGVLDGGAQSAVHFRSTGTSY